MDSWWDWLLSVCVPVAKRVLGSLGLGVLSFTGVSATLNAALDAAKAAWGGLLIEVAQLLAMAGFFDFMAITSGGIVAGIAWLTLKRWAITSGTVGGTGS